MNFKKQNSVPLISVSTRIMELNPVYVNVKRKVFVGRIILLYKVVDVFFVGNEGSRFPLNRLSSPF